MFSGRFALVGVVGLSFLVVAGTATGGSLRFSMQLVGANILFTGSQTSDLDVDPARDVAYLGSFVHMGVAVVDLTNRARPTVVDVLSTAYVDEGNTSDSADVDVQGNLLAVANQPWAGDRGFGGVTLYELTDPFHPVRRGQFSTGGTHDVQIDPGYPARPYVYAANMHSTFDVSIIDVSDLDRPALAATYRSPEPLGCANPRGCGEFGGPFNSAHDLTLLTLANGHTILYVAYWDSGIRLVDVTDAGRPREIGAIDSDPGPEAVVDFAESLGSGTCCSHYVQPTPSGRYVLAEDEEGVGGAGVVHVYRADGCDGVRTCVLTWVSDWSPPGRPVQASAIHAHIRTGGAVEPLGIFQRFFTRDVHNLDVRETMFLAAAYSSGTYLVDIADPATPRTLAFFHRATNVGQACHGINTQFAWGYTGTCLLQAFEAWGAKFGEPVAGSPRDFYVYVSDFWEGFLVLRTVTSAR